MFHNLALKSVQEELISGFNQHIQTQDQKFQSVHQNLNDLQTQIQNVTSNGDNDQILDDFLVIAQDLDIFKNNTDQYLTNLDYFVQDLALKVQHLESKFSFPEYEEPEVNLNYELVQVNEGEQVTLKGMDFVHISKPNSAF